MEGPNLCHVRELGFWSTSFEQQMGRLLSYHDEGLDEDRKIKNPTEDGTPSLHSKSINAVLSQ